MKTNKSLLGILIVLIVSISCKKDDDNSFDEIVEPTNNIVGSLWINNSNVFTELDLKDNQQINTFTTLSSFHCNEFNGTFICTQGEYTGTKTVQRKGSFNGDLMWSKDYVKDSERYFQINATAIHQNSILLSYRIVNATTYTSTYHLEALELDNGDVIWSIELGNEVKKFTPYKNKIITELSVGSSTVELLSINPDNGHIDTRIPFTDRISKLIGGASSILIMTWSNSIVSMDAELNVNWTFNTGSPNILGGYEIGNQFIFYSRDQTVYSIDKSEGDLIWNHTYTGKFPLAIDISNDTVFISHKEVGESNIVTKTLDIFTGEELDSYSYMTAEEWSSSATKYYFFDNHLLLFNIVPDDNKANIALLNLSDKTLLWERELDQIAYPHLIITPTGYYQ
tara:strand:- start:185 stop:1372 length:1188 start_codon:yes stop_codon:yes gene_type:complete